MNLNNSRPPAVAGQFYPDDRNELSAMIDDFLAQVEPRAISDVDLKNLQALIVPHAGYPFSGPVAAYAYQLLNQLPKDPNYQVILLGVSHFTAIDNTYADTHDFWQTPLGNVPIIPQNIFPKNKACHSREHSLEVQIPWLQKTLKNFSILPFLTNFDDPRALAERLLTLLQKPNTILIVSTDLSHYLPYPLAKATDQKTIKYILNLNVQFLTPEPERACGLNGVLTLLEISRQNNWQPRLLKYANSGDTYGDKSQVVGYAALVFIKTE